MRIGWLSVSPVARTGYGRMTREIVSRLLDKYEVICLGHESDVIVWGGKKYYNINGKDVLTLVFTNPLVNPKSALEIVNTYIKKYEFDVIIAHWDAFALEFLKDIKIPWLAYIPVDGSMTSKWANYVRSAYKIILYSKFGYDESSKFFHPSKLAYIPHGVDTDTFKPLNIPKEELRKNIEASPPIPEDCFLFIFIGANIGSRKLIPLLLRTFKKFVDIYPNAHLYLHTNSYARMGRGYDLPMLIDMLDLKKNVHLPTYNPILEGLSDEDMVKIYNAGDVYITNSIAEGFGLPVLEAQACGLPVITPRNSAQIELVNGHGWLVENIDEDEYVEYPVYVPQLTWYPVPNQKDLLAKMSEAYTNEGLRKKYSRMSREFALQYDWKKIIKQWYKLLDEVEEDIELFRSVV